MKTNSLLIFAAAFATAIHSTNAQIIINGGFETPDTPTYRHITSRENILAPWVVGLHSVEVTDAVGNGWLVGPAFEGAQFLDLTGTGRGRLTQAFATTPGSLYTVTFAYTDNYYEPSTPASATVRLFDALGDRLNQTVTHTGAVAGNYHWTVFNEQFTALQNTTSLEFTSLTASPNGLSGGIMLDAVQVFEAPPLVTIRTSQVEVCWNSQSNATYQVQYSSDLTTNLWTSLGGCVLGDGSVKCINDPVVVSQPQKFYRVVQTNCVPAL